MTDKTVSIVNGIVRVNGMERGRIVKRYGAWIMDLPLREYLGLLLGTERRQKWPTREAAAEWVKEQLANR